MDPRIIAIFFHPCYAADMRKPRIIWRLLFLLLTVLLLIVIGIWWWQQPAQFRDVARLSRIRVSESCTDGFIAEQFEPAYGFGLYNWQTGQRRWWLPVPPVTEKVPAMQYVSSVSTDGHEAGLATFFPDGIRLFRWRDGKTVRERWIPATLRTKPMLGAFNAVQITRDGRLWCSYLMSDGLGMLAIDRTDKIAHGKLQMPHTEINALINQKVIFAPDGRLMGIANPGRCYKLTVAGSRILASPVSRLKGNELMLFPGGICVDGTKKMHLPSDMTVALPNGPGYRYQQCGTVCLLHTNTAITILTPGQGGGGWTMHLPAGEFFDPNADRATPDGRFLLLRSNLNGFQRFPRPLREIARKTVTGAWRQRLQRSQTYFLLYERPGRLRVSLLLSDTLQAGFPALSPDGHSLALNISSSNGHLEETRLFRW